MMGRKFWTLALMIALCGLVATGCKRKSSKGTTINNSSSNIFTTDTFPGDAVQNGNVSDDQRAMSMSGDDYNGGLKCTHNGGRGTAMITYEVSNQGFYAQYYDGATWTPPVAIRAIDTDDDDVDDANIVCHAFINTDDDNRSDEAQARNGDCIIFYTNGDNDDTTTSAVGSDGANIAVFAEYFDVTFAGDISHRYGFQEYASRCNSQDEINEGATMLALVTDGLCGEARWAGTFGSQSGNRYCYGDETTSIEIVWRQIENNDADVAVEDAALYTSRFNLDTVGPEEDPLLPTAETRIGCQVFSFSSDGGSTSDETQVDDYVITYNNQLFFRVLETDTDPEAPQTDFDVYSEYGMTADHDVVLQYVNYTLGTGAITGAQHLQFVTPDAGDTDENNADFLRENADNVDSAGQFLAASHSVYGTDEGLAETVIFYCQLIEVPNAGGTGFFEDTTVADVDSNSRVSLAVIDPSDGSLDQEALLSIDTDGENDNAMNSYVDTRISRNGDYINVAWIQENQDIVAGVNNDGGHNGLNVVEFLTTRPDEDGFFTLLGLGTSVSSIHNVAPTTTEPVRWFEFQDCLGYICGAQSNPDIMSVFFEQSDGTIDEVDQIEVTAGLVTSSPSTFVSTYELFEEGDQDAFAFFGAGSTINSDEFGFRNFAAVDSGFDGFVFAGYSDDVDGTATDDYRQFAERTGPFSSGIVEVDSFVNFRQAGLFFGTPTVNLICTPPGTDIGRFDVVSLEDDEARVHGTEHIHYFFNETRVDDLGSANQGLKTREFVTDDNGETMSNNFFPNAGSSFVDPFMFDLPNIDPSDSADVQCIAVDGNTVGVWFTFLDRIYLQIFDEDHGDGGIGWQHEGEDDGTQANPFASNPFLVDDDTNEEIQFFEDCCGTECECNNLEGMMVFWVKRFPGQFNDRLQVRTFHTNSN